VLKLLDSVLKSEKKQKLLLMSEEDMTWLTEDKHYLGLWVSLLRKIIETGHTITMIHIVNRDISQILSVLDHWMPLHMTGMIESYYYPKYIETTVKQTYLIIRDEAAVVSFAAQGKDSDNCSFYYTDPRTIKIFEDNYMAYLAKCKSLLNVYTTEKSLEYFEHGVKIDSMTGCTYSMIDSLNGVFIPDSFYMKFITALPGDKAYEISRLLKQWKDGFSSNIKYYKYFDFIPAGIISDIIHQRPYTHMDNRFFWCEPVRFDTNDLISYLEDIILALKFYDNYELILLESIPHLDSVAVQITYKENAAATFTSNTPKNAPASIVLNEGNIMSALGYYFDEYMQNTPGINRSKTEVIRRLKKAVSVLKDQGAKSRLRRLARHRQIV
jgi:hypothetical protein